MISRRNAPPVVKDAARAAVRTVGRFTHGARLLPRFLIVGAQRSGTTTLFRHLADHPSVAPPLFHKGVHYFDVNYHRGWPWYRGHFPVAAVARHRAGTAAVTFESSGYYMHHPLAPKRIAADLPGVRLVVLLRDPVERAYSAHKHEFARGFETEQFERALDLEPSRLAGEVAKICRDGRYLSHAHRHHSYLDRGLYAGQISRLFDHFGRDRVLVLFAEDFFATPDRSLGRVLDFLGLPQWRPAVFARYNARPSSPMAASLRKRLTDYFAPHDAALAVLLGETPAWRR